MVREQLARIVHSPIFVQPNRLSRFLRFVEELSHELMATGGCRVQTVSSILTPDIHNIACFAKKLGAQLVFEGTVRKEIHTFLTTSRVVDADGFQVWSQQFEMEADQSGLFGITKQI